MDATCLIRKKLEHLDRILFGSKLPSSGSAAKTESENLKKTLESSSEHSSPSCPSIISSCGKLLVHGSACQPQSAS